MLVKFSYAVQTYKLRGSTDIYTPRKCSPTDLSFRIKSLFRRRVLTRIPESSMGNRIRSSECSYELQCTIVLNSILHVSLCGVQVFEIL